MTLREALTTIGPVTFDALLAYCRAMNIAHGYGLPNDARHLARGLRDLQEGNFARKTGEEWEAVEKPVATLF